MQKKEKPAPGRRRGLRSGSWGAARGRVPELGSASSGRGCGTGGSLLLPPLGRGGLGAPRPLGEKGAGAKIRLSMARAKKDSRRVPAPRSWLAAAMLWVGLFSASPVTCRRRLRYKASAVPTLVPSSTDCCKSLNAHVFLLLFRFRGVEPLTVLVASFTNADAKKCKPRVTEIAHLDQPAGGGKRPFAAAKGDIASVASHFPVQ